MQRELTGQYTSSGFGRLWPPLAGCPDLMDAFEHQLGLVREMTGQKRNRVYAYTAYIDILNRD